MFSDNNHYCQVVLPIRGKAVLCYSLEASDLGGGGGGEGYGVRVRGDIMLLGMSLLIRRTRHFLHSHK